MGLTLTNLGLALHCEQDFVGATPIYEESLALARELEDEDGVVAALHNLGLAAHHQGQEDRAARFLAESLRLAHALGDKANIATRLTGLDGGLAALDRPERDATPVGPTQ